MLYRLIFLRVSVYYLKSTQVVAIILALVVVAVASYYGAVAYLPNGLSAQENHVLYLVGWA